MELTRDALLDDLKAIGRKSAADMAITGTEALAVIDELSIIYAGAAAAGDEESLERAANVARALTDLPSSEARSEKFDAVRAGLVGGVRMIVQLAARGLKVAPLFLAVWVLGGCRQLAGEHAYDIETAGILPVTTDVALTLDAYVIADEDLEDAERAGLLDASAALLDAVDGPEEWVGAVLFGALLEPVAVPHDAYVEADAQLTLTQRSVRLLATRALRLRVKAASPDQ
jgi:hypothetical protein